jgi:hypothetical protein
LKIRRSLDSFDFPDAASLAAPRACTQACPHVPPLHSISMRVHARAVVARRKRRKVALPTMTRAALARYLAERALQVSRAHWNPSLPWRLERACAKTLILVCEPVQSGDLSWEFIMPANLIIDQ